jgi:hypothetical protein
VAFFHRILKNMQDDAAETSGALYPVMSTTSGPAYTLGAVTLASPTLTSPTFSGAMLGGKRTVVDTGGAFATPIVLTAANSGSIYLLDDAAGLDFTLPAITASDTGIEYTFFVTVTNTSNSYRITAATGDLYRGCVWVVDTNAVYTAPQGWADNPDESNDVIIDLTSDASGGMLGGWLTLTAIHATGWFVRGVLQADGTIVTIFS